MTKKHASVLFAFLCTLLCASPLFACTPAEEPWVIRETFPEQLRRSVKQVYGKSLYQCVRAYKMRLAAKLLRETERTVSDIAGEFGYDNSSKFACAFQSILGIPPGEYRVSGPPSGTPLLILE